MSSLSFSEARKAEIMEENSQADFALQG